ncbi:NHL repeat-containing protein [Halosimplex aquaticum]|uniref:NHL repeat-containing protein n=1 Tax=Halosimplex aquaticum TaxID=3026162 RepID=A0ABD5Y604_9EURY|nr:NHL repeat-containing protein [Halosimplex aquaticum]
MGGFTFRRSYGSRSPVCSPRPPTPLTECDLQLASPVGLAQDRRGNVWIADAGHNRLLVVDDTLERLLGQVGTAGDEPGSFDLPLRLAHHPTAAAVYVADTGNGRVQRLDYEYDGEVPRVSGVDAFAATGEFHPNGVVAHEYRDGVRVVAADEFYREGDDLRGRLVVFDEDGTELRSIRSIGAEDPVPLYWPQGLDVDDAGRLYVANTGYGVLHDGPTGPPKLASIVRCDRWGEPAPFEGCADAVLDDLPMPRDVAVVGSGRDAQIFVPDAGTGRVHVYTSVGIPDGVVPESDEDLRAHAGLEDGVGIPRDGRLDEPGDGDPGEQRRFEGPVGIRPFDGVSAPDSDADDPTLALLVSEAMSQRVGAYAVDVHRETGRRFGTVGGVRDDPGQFSVPTGSAVVGADGGPLSGSGLVADGANGRLQRFPLDGTVSSGDSAPDDGADALAPVALPATRFPFGLAFWPSVGGGGRLFVTDYTARYREDDRGQIHVYAVDEDASGERGAVDLSLVHSFGSWGLGEGEVKLPRGVAVEPVGGQRARVYAADSGNGRIGVWEYDWVSDAATPLGDRGCFGYIEGGFWNPSDVAVGRRGLYVADENNHRVQRYDGDEWHAVGAPGYGSGHEFLLPISVDTHDGYLFVLDLVTRAVCVFAEDGDADGGLRPVDSMRAFGGDAASGDLWLPYLLSVGDVSDAAGVDAVVPDSTLHVAHHYTWSSEE